MAIANIKGVLTVGAMSGGVTDVKVNNVSVVDTDGIANINLTDYETKAHANTTFATKSELTNGLSSKQNTLIAGDNITINNDEISADVPEIVGNPTGTATEDLTSIKIDDAIFGIAAGGINFSESEFDTGMKWTDGKTIYGKVITSLNDYGAGTWAVDLWQTGLTQIIGYWGKVLQFNSLYNPIPYYNNSGEYFYCYYHTNDGRLYVKANYGWQALSLIIFYIK